MDDIIQQFSSVSLSDDLINDVKYLIFCYKTNQIELDISKFKLQDNYDIRILYYDIIKIIYNLNETCIILEMMPLIDNYLEYYSTCATFNNK